MPPAQRCLKPADSNTRSRIGLVMSSISRRDAAPSGGIVAQNEAEVQFTARFRETGAGLPDRARWLPVSVADHAVRATRSVGPIPRL